MLLWPLLWPLHCRRSFQFSLKKSGVVTATRSPLADHPAAASASRGTSYAGRKFPRGGRQRRVGGRGRGQVKVDPKVPRNSSFKRGFQE